MKTEDQIYEELKILVVPEAGGCEVICALVRLLAASVVVANPAKAALNAVLVQDMIAEQVLELLELEAVKRLELTLAACGRVNSQGPSEIS